MIYRLKKEKKRIIKNQYETMNMKSWIAKWICEKCEWHKNTRKYYKNKKKTNEIRLK